MLIGGRPVASGQNDNPDARFLTVVREYTLQKDGSQEFRESFSVKLLSHRAFHRMYGENFIVYNPQFQKLKIHKAETQMDNGRKVPAPANAFNEVLPSWASGSAAFSHLREMVVSHTALEVGATVSLDYTIETRAGYYPCFSGAEVASLSSPADAFRVVVRVPAGTRLSYKVLNLRLAPEISKEKGFDVYTFNFGSTQALPQESFLPSRFSYLPAVVFSTSGSVEAILPPLSLSGEGLPAQAKNWVLGLKEKSANTAELLASLRDKVANEIATLQVKPIYTGFRLRSLREVWESRSGTPAEKACLLAAMLREVGFTAHPMVAFPSQLVQSDLLPAALAEDFYVQTEGDGLPELLLSPTSATTRDERPFLYGMTLLGTDPQGKVLVNRPTPVNSECRVEATLNIDTGANLSGSVKVKAEGLFNPYFPVNTDKSKFSGVLRGLQGDKTEVNLQRSNPRKAEGLLTVSGQKALKKKGEVYLLEIPHAAAGVDSWNARVLPVRRDGPFALPAFVLEEYKFSITLPEGWELLTPEYSREVKKDFGGVSLKLVKKGNTVEIYQAVEFIEKEISLLNYPSLREILINWYDPGLQVLVLRKK